MLFRSTKIFKAKIIETNESHPAVGEIKTDGRTYIYVKCGKGSLAIEELQLAGKKNLPVKDFLLGFRGIETFKFS